MATKKKTNDVIDQTTNNDIVEPTAETKTEPTKVLYTINNCTALNVRKEPNLKAEIVCVVDKTIDLTIKEIESDSEWVKVRTSTGKRGFCMKKFVCVK